MPFTLQTTGKRASVQSEGKGSRESRKKPEQMRRASNPSRTSTAETSGPSRQQISQWKEEEEEVKGKDKVKGQEPAMSTTL